ncbi:hypothetical protein ACHAPJ_012018 [Fusarium lateritium]
MRNASLVYILAERNYARLIKSALYLDPRINIEGEHYGYPLFGALADGHQEAVSALLQETSVELGNSIFTQLLYGRDFRIFDIQNPLQSAMRYGRVWLAKHLTFSKESRDSMGSDSDREVLLWAARDGHTDVVKLALAIRGIDINTRDSLGRTPLSLAAEKGHQDVVRLLAEVEGINLESTSGDGLTPLLSALFEGHEDIMKLFIQTGGIDVNRSTLGRTPLSHAATLGRYGIVELLLGAEGIQANSKDDDGVTALIIAAMFGYLEIVKLLLNVEGIEASLRDNSGKTALHYASVLGHQEIMKLLL